MISPGKKWKQASNPLIGITPIMDWAKAHYASAYAPNTRETFLRQTMHQFVAAGIAFYNPDDPARATNSSNAVYQIEPATLTLLPFGDGNGRTARALATTELWRSKYDMRGFLSLEEHYTADLNAYYDNLQMGLPVNFYEGRHDPDHSQWLEYFLATMANAAQNLEQQAIALHAPEQREAPPWESLRRVQQQLLNRLLFMGMEGATAMVLAQAT